MKKELTPATIGIIIALAVVVLGGIGFMYLGNAGTASNPGKEREELEAQAAASRYQGITGQTSNGAPQGGPPQGEAEARARTQTQGSGL